MAVTIYKANDKYNAVLSSGYTAGQNTLSVSAVPDNVPTIVVLAKGTDNETVFSVTGKTINSLTGVARLRGANIDLDAQTPVTCLNNEEFVNQYATALFSGEGLADFIYGVDGGSNDTYVISLTVAPTDYASLTGVPILFKANTANTGAATLNINSLGAKTIKKLNDQDLATNDIEAGQIVQVVYDGTNFQMQSQVAQDLSSVTSALKSATTIVDVAAATAPSAGQVLKATDDTHATWQDESTNTDGWITIPHTLVYVSASSFKITGVDVTSLFTKGARIKCTNNTLKYWVVAGSTFSTDTTVTILTTTDYVVENTAISSPYYSYQVNPQGYPTWFNITPTTSNLGGFSSVAGYIWKWRVEGSSCTMIIHVQGTSNSASFTITAPVANVSQSTTSDYVIAVLDNGTWAASPGVLGVPSATATLLVGKTIGSIASGVYAGFTGSGTKGVNGQITYQF